MILMRLMILFTSYTIVDVRYSLYYSDIRHASYLTFDCLHAHIVENEKNRFISPIPNDHLSPYCRRSDNGEEQEEISDISHENIANKITFKELSKQGVTSEHLLKWSTPIDVAERYEMNNTTSEFFYNCSSPWFGSKCQYRFVHNLALSFSEIVKTIMTSRSNISLNMSNVTCYRFLSGCDRGPWSLCLDWREICDGKVDCMSGEDEQWCETLEITKCADDEYRCHYGGQCIPLIFAEDGDLGADCLDGSEESEKESILYNPLANAFCADSLLFQCQERTSRYPLAFSCGNGQYLRQGGLPTNMVYCDNNRDKQVILAMFTSFDHINNVDCRETFRCLLLSNRSYGYNMAADTFESYVYFDGNWSKNCELLANHCSDEWLMLPAKPIMFGYFQFIYLTNRSVDEFKKNVAPDFVCFDAQKCPSLASKIDHIDIVDGLTCCHISNLTQEVEMQHFHMVNIVFFNMYDQCSKAGIEVSCENSSYFYCNESLKCISYQRVGDGLTDCYLAEDESFPACQLNDSNRLVCISSETQCFLPVAIQYGNPNCPKAGNERLMSRFAFNKQVPFAALCDDQGYSIFSMIDVNETDETNCELWPCNNPYTRCNGIWNCLNGMDELNCPDTICSFNEFQCDNKVLNLTYCLPLAYMFYKRIGNCTKYELIQELYFNHDTNYISEDYYSFNTYKCISGNTICNHHLEKVSLRDEGCHKGDQSPPFISNQCEVSQLDNDKTYLCTIDLEKRSFDFTYTYFLITTRLGYFPTISSTIPPIQHIPESNQGKESIPQTDKAPHWYCHEGVLVLFGINQTKTCLCPPNYFGSQCQWQNQRVSLTLQLKMQSTISTTVIFQLIIMLIDEQGTIAHNYEQIIYILAHQCTTKYNIYLLYPHRPKHPSANYSIHIDLFDKITLDYWTSWYVPIPFQFLPVNRIAIQLIMPEKPEKELCSLLCGKHGRCVKYTNMKSLYFCQCDQGYTGSRCNVTHECQCSNGSLCLAPSICVCPLHNFGSRCYLKRSICQTTNNPCQHDGICVPTDDRIDLHSFICFCQEGYSGERCQYKSNQIDIHVDEAILAINSSLFIHYITAYDKSIKHERTTILKKIAFGQNSITIHVPQPFHILFVQIPNSDYYLTVLREKFIPSEHIQAQVLSKQRCSLVHNLLNSTVREYRYLHRVKYYPLLCRQNSHLMCFYDEYNMCICDSDRFSNCFEFNHTIKHHCQGENLCQNGGHCFQNNETCPSKFICICEDCYYGTRCELTTKGFIFSLDPILGYHIKPNVSLNRQPFIVKLSIAIITIMLVSGLITGSLSVATFHLKKPREVGCGYYLLASSISSICMIVILAIKFCHLLLSQMSLITNRSMLFAGCVSIEIILKVLLALSEWFNACVAIERTITVVKSLNFNKNMSKTIAKRMIFVIILLTSLTHLHDPLRRKLVDDLDGDQKRIWCFSDYSPSEIIYNTFITLFHFLVPFTIHLISALILIKVAAHSRSKVGPRQAFKRHFKLQFQRHKHILIAPCMLILLSLPRLIISFTSGCMRSAREPWLHLIGYLVSFIPTMLTFFVFVLPSTTYKSEFNEIVVKTIKRFYSTP